MRCLTCDRLWFILKLTTLSKCSMCWQSMRHKYLTSESVTITVRAPSWDPNWVDLLKFVQWWQILYLRSCSHVNSPLSRCTADVSWIQSLYPFTDKLWCSSFVVWTSSKIEPSQPQEELCIFGVNQHPDVGALRIKGWGWLCNIKFCLDTNMNQALTRSSNEILAFLTSGQTTTWSNR